MNVRGSALKIGDQVEVWRGTATITKLVPYEGPLSYLFSEGAQIAHFIDGMCMTMDNDEIYSVVRNVFE